MTKNYEEDFDLIFVFIRHKMSQFSPHCFPSSQFSQRSSFPPLLFVSFLFSSLPSVSSSPLHILHPVEVYPVLKILLHVENRQKLVRTTDIDQSFFSVTIHYSYYCTPHSKKFLSYFHKSGSLSAPAWAASLLTGHLVGNRAF